MLGTTEETCALAFGNTEMWHVCEKSKNNLWEFQIQAVRSWRQVLVPTEQFQKQCRFLQGLISYLLLLKTLYHGLNSDLEIEAISQGKPMFLGNLFLVFSLASFCWPKI